MEPKIELVHADEELATATLTEFLNILERESIRLNVICIAGVGTQWTQDGQRWMKCGGRITEMAADDLANLVSHMAGEIVRRFLDRAQPEPAPEPVVNSSKEESKCY